MHTPLVLDAPLQLAAQTSTVRLSGPVWQALLASLSLDAAEASLPGTATVLAHAQGEAVRIEYAGRVASFPWSLPLAAGSSLRLARSLGTPAPPPGSPAPNRAQLSPTAQTLAQVLEASVRESLPALTLRVEKTAGQSPPQQVAAALADAISGSGMFFESHLAEWVQGARNTGSVLAEAQVRAATETGTAGTGPFQQQVAALATGEMAFLFPAWPGQRVALSVSGEPGPGPQNGAAERSFFAHLEMDLPELGSVHAVLSLNPQRIDVDLRAAVPQTAQALDENRGTLAHALAAAGLHVGRIEVGSGL